MNCNEFEYNNTQRQVDQLFPSNDIETLPNPLPPTVEAPTSYVSSRPPQ